MCLFIATKRHHLTADIHNSPLRYELRIISERCRQSSFTSQIFKMDNLKKLQQIPGIGPKLSKEFFDIGIKDILDFKGKNPEDLYSQICKRQGIKVDKCVLYVCRSAVYFSESNNPDPEKTKWWNWKD
jgi:spore coat polysaccharide biosynthesis protein SpsF (cytidylyltransferase family)